MKHSLAEQRLEEDHRSLGDSIAQLCVALEDRDVERSFERLDLVWARLAVHIRAEHLCLFPAVLDAASEISAHDPVSTQLDEARSAIEHLRHDHDFFMVELARVVNAIRGLRSSHGSQMPEEMLRDVRHTINAVKARLEEHNQLEEEQVYRWPAAFLSPARQAQLDDCVCRELENMPPRFGHLPPQGSEGIAH